MLSKNQNCYYIIENSIEKECSSGVFYPRWVHNHKTGWSTIRLKLTGKTIFSVLQVQATQQPYREDYKS